MVHSWEQVRRQGEAVAEGLGTQHRSETSKNRGLCTGLLLDMFKSDPATKWPKPIKYGSCKIDFEYINCKCSLECVPRIRMFRYIPVNYTGWQR